MRLASRIRLVFLIAAGIGLGTAPPTWAQCVSLTTAGTAYTQNFDTLSSTAGSTTNNLAVTGWFLTESGGGARDNEQYGVDTGGSTTGDTYSYGAAGSTERALGSLQSGTLIPTVGACFTNNTGATIAGLGVVYTGEQWRLGTAARTDQINFEYSTNATDLVTGTWTGVAPLTFVTPDTVTTGAKNGNSAAERTATSATISSLAVPNGATFWIRWTDTNATGADDGLAVDDFSLTPLGGSGLPSLSVSDMSAAEGDAGATTFTFTVGLGSPAGAGGVSFDIATADGTAADGNPATEDADYVALSLTGQMIPAGSSTYTFSVTVNGDSTVEPEETFFVNVTNLSGADAVDMQGQGTILNDDAASVFIHDVQGNGASTPMPAATVRVEGIVTGSYQGAAQLRGFFLQEEDTHADADPATSEGLFVYCNACTTPVAEGQRVQATGTVSEYFAMTEMTASTAGAVVVTDAANNLLDVTPAPISLPVVGAVDAFYEAREGMLVSFVDTLTVAETSGLARFGQVELFAGGRPQQFTETSTPSVAGYAAHLASLAARRVILDDDNDTPNAPLALPAGGQFVYHPRAGGGFSAGTQGFDFFRGGDQVNGLTGVLQWSFAGSGSVTTWRVRPTAAAPAAFTVANPRPSARPAVGGAIRAAGMNLLNYFTTIDTTTSSSSGPCGPSGTLDCRGADSIAELDRQRERASLAICGLDAHVIALVEIENTTPSAAIDDLLGAVNARCGGADPYAAVATGGTLGTDAIRVALVYRSTTLSPVGAPLVDLDPVHSRPPTAQTFDVVDPANLAFGERFTVVANHFKSKGCAGTGTDADAGDGAGCFNGTRTAQATRLLTWLSGTVLPAAGDVDVLLLGDFNSYAREDPIATLQAGGFTDLEATSGGAGAYSYVFDGQLGHLDYALTSASLTPRVAGVGAWHVNADEASLFDYDDEVKDTGESAFEAKPDGSALVPPRVVFEPETPYRAADHDPILVGLFPLADLAITKTGGPDPVAAGATLTYTITVASAGPDPASAVALADTLPSGTTFVALASPAGWSCSTPAVGAGGTVSCSQPTLASGSTSVFTLTVALDAGLGGGTVLANTAVITAGSIDPSPADNAATATTTVVSCLYSVSPASASVSAAGGVGAVAVQAGPGCAWTAISNDLPWLSVSSGAAGTGNGSVSWSVASNPGASRGGTLAIAGHTFTVAQAPAATPPSSGPWHGWFAVTPLETPMVGDFDGDGRADVITFTRQSPLALGDVYVALSDGARFVGRSGAADSSDQWHDWFAISTDETVVIGDYDGDGKDDVATWLGKSTRQVYVALSSGAGLQRETVWLDRLGFDATDVVDAGDVDGDGRADLVCFARKQGKVYVALSTASGFLPPQQWHGFFAVSTYERPRLADVNGDGRSDIVTFATDSATAYGDVYVAVSNGTGFVDQDGNANSSTKWHDWFAINPAERVRIGDLDGDGKQDFFTFLPSPIAQCYTVQSLGTSLGPNVLWPDPLAPLSTDTPFVGDANGDGKADVIVFAQGEGKVYVSLGQ